MTRRFRIVPSDLHGNAAHAATPLVPFVAEGMLAALDRDQAAVAAVDAPPAPGPMGRATSDPVAFQKPVAIARDASITTIAATAHAAVIQWLEANGQPAASPFGLLPQDRRREAIERARSVMAAIGRPDDHEHRAWVTMMAQDGWREGDFDRRARTHPDLVPFDELPDWMQREYRLYRAIVEVLS